MIILLGAACSGKTTVIQKLKEDADLNYVDFKIEYATRPKRDNEVGDEYHFIDTGKFQKIARDMAAIFNVDTRFDGWRYGILESDITSNGFIVTNPTNFYQLTNNPEIKNKIHSIYLRVSERERMMRMLKRGDNLQEAYRRVIHDSGHFSGIEELADLNISGENDFDIYYEAIVQFIKEFTGK